MISGNGGNGVSISDAGTTGNVVEGDYHRHRRHRHARPGQRRRRTHPERGDEQHHRRDHGRGPRRHLRQQLGWRRNRRTGTTGNVVEGDHIGTNAGGSAGLGNADSGVAIYGGASDNTIGGTTAGAGNVISGNAL